MVDLLIYGKIIADNIRLKNGELVYEILGGGGPQACFGARLWNNSIGFFTRTGTDIKTEHVDSLNKLRIDLQGWTRYEDLPTPICQMMYDENEIGIGVGMLTSEEAFFQMLARPLIIPESYQKPKAIHLITEFADEPMVENALQFKKNGAIFSFEPLIDYRKKTNVNEMVELIKQVDIVTPDWPSACLISNNDEPRKVLDYWTKLGPRLVAIRHGHHGSYVWDSIHDEHWHVSPAPVIVIDPTGGGNSYGGGLFSGWYEKQDALQAAVRGTVAANFLIRQYGIPEISDPLINEANKLVEIVLDLAKPL